MLSCLVPSRRKLCTYVFSSQTTELYDPQAFFTHAALLRQTFVHCAIFPTAASRRSLDRVSVPVWLIILSDQLPIVALVGRYPHQLANGTQAHLRVRALTGSLSRKDPYGLFALCGISPPFGRLFHALR